MPDDLRGRSAIVTGGARGIGKEIVRELAAAGCDVVINANSSASAAQALATEVAELGVRAEVVVGSVADPATATALADSAMAAFGRIDILVNNAGINRDSTVRKMADEDFQDVIDINLTGTHRASQAVLGHMCEAGFGRIVNVSSFVGQVGNFGQANYAASKAGVIGWSKALAVEVARYGITVNCVCPGFVDTDMLAGVPDEVREKLLLRVPLRRFATAQEVAKAVLYVVRDGDYMTGACLDLNGGIAL